MTTADVPQEVPYRQIRAEYDDNLITVYQAYSEAIGTAAVSEQLLSASPQFSYGRMTWIKPSWAWMCYRAGYSYKDARQARILAIKMRQQDFIELLRQAFTGHGAVDEANANKAETVRVQWDPERTAALEKLPYRSIQIGIPRGLSQKWVEEQIVSIEDVTERAQKLKKMIENDPDMSVEDLLEASLVPVERVFDVPDDVRQILKMD